MKALITISFDDGLREHRDGWRPINVERFTAWMEELAKYRDKGSVDVVTFKRGASYIQVIPKHERKLI